MLNELEEIKNLNSIHEVDNYIKNNADELNKLNLEQKQQIANLYLEKQIYQIQNDWANSEITNILNTALDIGLRIILPDYLDEQVIELKNNIINFGVKEGFEQSINDVVQRGKEAIGLLTNNFESISDAKNAVKKGGTLDIISELVDKGVDALKDNKKIDTKTAKTIKKEKDNIIKSVEANIDITFENQIADFEKLEKYISNWKEAYNLQDYNSMQKEYKKMEKIMSNLMPLEKTISEFRTIENLQTLIKNNGKNFNLSQEELELANKLIK